jgi:hypothetical protein
MLLLDQRHYSLARAASLTSSPYKSASSKADCFVSTHLERTDDAWLEGSNDAQQNAGLLLTTPQMSTLDG